MQDIAELEQEFWETLDAVVENSRRPT
jgi:hypothetical protein